MTRDVSNRHRRVLIVDDQLSIHDDVRKILVGPTSQQLSLAEDERLLFGDSLGPEPTAGFDVISATQGQAAVRLVLEACEEDRPFAVAFVDVRMPPGWDGVTTIEHLWEIDPRLQIVLCTAFSDYSPQEVLSRLGQTDRLMVLKKPFDKEEVQLLTTSLAEKWRLERIADQQRSDFEREIASRTHEIAATRDLTVFVLAKLAESRDPETGEHLARMRAYTQIIAEELADHGPYADRIDATFLEDLYRSSPLHDIGKVGIPDRILLKPGKLTPEEFAVMKQHTVIGAETLAMAAGRSHSGSFLRMAVDIARHHHERFDGRGYPDELVGEAIPFPARIVAVADVFDALTSKRIYKAAMPADEATKIIVGESGRQFDAIVVEAFTRRLPDLLAARDAINGGQINEFGTTTVPRFLDHELTFGATLAASA